ncbi:MAG: ATP-binding cassette domain-containing protein [Propionibacteriaceae bacterium]|jgi:ABC-2 type transport system ATP-binding protein|nr:ATP-binding cassette domain-containing protein [Propionibacteriaceae bacterium]
MAPVIEVEDLVKQYKRTKRAAVRGISLTVDEGQFFAFLGPNGAGKTTTISILTTTLAKTSGRVRIAGCDIDAQDRQVRQRIGVIAQRSSLDKILTAEENIRVHACLYGLWAWRPGFKLMPAAYRQRVRQLAEVVGVGDALFTRVGKLSGGMARKFEVVRSLIHTPPVLFLDEPTQGLDAVSRHDLWDYLDQVRREWGTTIFLTTHYIDEAEGADTVCLINHGRIAWCCPPQEMKRSLGADSLEEAYVDFLRQDEANHQGDDGQGGGGHTGVAARTGARS